MLQTQLSSLEHTQPHTENYGRPLKNLVLASCTAGNTLIIESFRSAVTVNVDIINYNVMLSAGNIHGELLTFRTVKTTFHCMPIPVSYFAVQRIPFNIL